MENGWVRSAAATALVLPRLLLLVSKKRHSRSAAKWKLTLELCSCGTRLAREGQR
jgi:hypothetical protein